MKTVRVTQKDVAAFLTYSMEIEKFRIADNEFKEAVLAFSNADQTNNKALEVFRKAVDLYCHAMTSINKVDSNFFSEEGWLQMRWRKIR